MESLKKEKVESVADNRFFLYKSSLCIYRTRP